MPKHDGIQNEELRGLLDAAWTALRARQTGDAVHRIAGAFLRLVELHPELLRRRAAGPRGRGMPLVMRWPSLGANIKIESIRGGKLEIDFVRETFAVSEALTYYEFTVETALDANV